MAPFTKSRRTVRLVPCLSCRITRRALSKATSFLVLQWTRKITFTLQIPSLQMEPFGSLRLKGAMSVFASNIQPIGLTIRNGNNLFVSTAYEDGDGSNGAGIPGGGKIIQIAPSGAQTVVASGLGDLDLRGIGLDHFGNFYVTDHSFGNHGNPDVTRPVLASMWQISRPLPSGRCPLGSAG